LTAIGAKQDSLDGVGVGGQNEVVVARTERIDADALVGGQILADLRLRPGQFELESLQTASYDVGVELSIVVGREGLQRNAIEVYFPVALTVEDASVGQGLSHHALAVRAATDFDQLPPKPELLVPSIRVDRVVLAEEMHFVVARPEGDFRVAVVSAHNSVARVVREYVEQFVRARTAEGGGPAVQGSVGVSLLVHEPVVRIAVHRLEVVEAVEACSGEAGWARGPLLVYRVHPRTAAERVEVEQKQVLGVLVE